jgi:glycosyltransferase involved in cell wall biosynthesis
LNFVDEIVVLILTFNEAANIGRTLHALRAFPEIVVLDSGSSDETAKIVGKHSNSRLVQRAFDTHANQWNYGLTGCGLARPWVLALDADYLLPESLVEELARLTPRAGVAGYRTRFRYCVMGRPLSATLYPPVVTLFRRQQAHFIQVGHTQRVVIEGMVAELRGRIDHDDRKSLSRWFSSQKNYAVLEAQHLLAMPRSGLPWSDRIRKMAWPAPLLVFVYTLVVKRCVFDGWAGWFYVMQRTLAEILIALELAERRLKGG